MKTYSFDIYGLFKMVRHYQAVHTITILGNDGDTPAFNVTLRKKADANRADMVKCENAYKVIYNFVLGYMKDPTKNKLTIGRIGVSTDIYTTGKEA